MARCGADELYDLIDSLSSSDANLVSTLQKILRELAFISLNSDGAANDTADYFGGITHQMVHAEMTAEKAERESRAADEKERTREAQRNAAQEWTRQEQARKQNTPRLRPPQRAPPAANQNIDDLPPSLRAILEESKRPPQRFL